LCTFAVIMAFFIFQNVINEKNYFSSLLQETYWKL
jgi:hypothetical protein